MVQRVMKQNEVGGRCRDERWCNLLRMNDTVSVVIVEVMSDVVWRVAEGRHHWGNVHQVMICGITNPTILKWQISTRLCSVNTAQLTCRSFSFFFSKGIEPVTFRSIVEGIVAEPRGHYFKMFRSLLTCKGRFVLTNQIQTCTADQPIRVLVNYPRQMPVSSVD